MKSRAARLCFSAIFVLVLLELVALTEPLAYAKKVSIEWKAVGDASRYEFIIRSKDNRVMTKILSEPEWRGDLAPGVYFYQVRALDRFEGAGLWTPLKSLVVMPPPPAPKFPANGAKISLFHPGIETSLKWEPVSGVQNYQVELFKEKTLVSKTSVRGTALTLKGLPSGNYIWKVYPVLKPDNRAPASFAEKTWISPEGEKGEFEIQLKELQAPTLVKPIRAMPPAEDQIVKLEWDEVEGAEAYEVHFLKAAKGMPARSLANQMNQARTVVTKENSLRVKMTTEGSYLWGVRALAHIDEKKQAHAVGPESFAQFSLDRNAVYQGDAGYVAFSSMFAPYSYQMTSPSQGFVGSTKASALAFRLSGEYWMTPLWAIAGAVETANYQMVGQEFVRQQFEITGKYRTKLSRGQYGWSLSPRLGAELRTYNQVLLINPSTFTSGIKVNDVYTLGAAVGFDLRKQFNESLSLGIKANYFYPISIISGVSGGQLSDQASYRNMSFGIQGLYWLTRSLGLGAGGYFELRSIGFTPAGQSQSELIYTDGAFFFGSVVYRFWR